MGIFQKIKTYLLKPYDYIIHKKLVEKVDKQENLQTESKDKPFQIEIIEKEKPAFDLPLYKELLQKILSTAQENYKILSIDWRNRQSHLIRTYLWLSVTLMIAQISLFASVWSQAPSSFIPWHITATWYFYVLAFISLALSWAVFFLGIDAMRGREDGIFLPCMKELDNELCLLAHQDALDSASSVSNYTLYADMLGQYQRSITGQIKTNTIVGRKLRKMSYILLLSIFFSGLTIIPWGKIIYIV